MRILISNDDGIYSPGIRALARVARRFGEVRVVAPDVERSSAGHAITSRKPLYWRPTPLDGIDAWRVDGTPADCVALGVSQWEPVGAVLSGINLGPNLGNSMWHSGTLAAAKQATLLGVQGIAFSTPTDGGEPDFDRLAPWVARVLEEVLGDRQLPLVNVNLPPDPRGLCWARQSVRHYDGEVVPASDPMGREHFWFVVRPIEDVEEGTDRWSLQQGLVALTPLRLDLTDHERLAAAAARHPVETTSHGPAADR